jgi:hypothetical protein
MRGDPFRTALNETLDVLWKFVHRWRSFRVFLEWNMIHWILGGRNLSDANLLETFSFEYSQNCMGTANHHQCVPIIGQIPSLKSLAWTELVPSTARLLMEHVCLEKLDIVELQIDLQSLDAALDVVRRCTSSTSITLRHYWPINNFHVRPPHEPLHSTLPIVLPQLQTLTLQLVDSDSLGVVQLLNCPCLESLSVNTYLDADEPSDVLDLEKEILNHAMTNLPALKELLF